MTPDWASRALELAGGRGIDFDLENGGAESIAQSIRVIVFGGVVAVIGFLAKTTQGEMPDVAALAISRGCIVSTPPSNPQPTSQSQNPKEEKRSKLIGQRSRNHRNRVSGRHNPLIARHIRDSQQQEVQAENAQVNEEHSKLRAAATTYSALNEPGPQVDCGGLIEFGTERAGFGVCVDG
ncbi:hypothetical protein BDW71DRAFT_208294 [Aspergillus fruticulosus]